MKISLRNLAIGAALAASPFAFARETYFTVRTNYNRLVTGADFGVEALGADIRMATGVNGTFYVLNKTTGVIYSIDGTSISEYATVETLHNGNALSCGITADDAGNLLISYSTGDFWADALKGVAIIPADGSGIIYVDELEMPEDWTCGRADNLGRIVGNMLSSEGAYFYLTGNKSDNRVACYRIHNGIFEVQNNLSASYSTTGANLTYAVPMYNTLREQADCYPLSNGAVLFPWNGQGPEMLIDGTCVTLPRPADLTYTATPGGDVINYNGRLYYAIPYTTIIGRRTCDFVISDEDGNIYFKTNNGEAGGLTANLAATGSFINGGGLYIHPILDKEGVFELYWWSGFNQGAVCASYEIEINKFANDFVLNIAKYIPDGVSTEIVKVSSGVMSAIQFDVTVPEGVVFDIPESVASQLTIQKSVLEGNTERYVAYTNDGEALGTEFICTATATNAQRSTLSISNIILSINDDPVKEADIEIPVLGYPFAGLTLPSVKAGESTYLSKPAELNYDDITVSWKPYNSQYGVLTEYGLFTAISQGTINDLGLTISDPRVKDLLDATATISVYGMIGDADCSGAIDIADVVATVNYILMKNPEPFDFYYADVDGSGDINVADVTRIIKLVLAQPKGALANAPMRAQAMNREIKVAADSEGVDSEGKQHLYISLDGDREYTALQLDIELTDGVTIETVKTGHGVASHILADACIDEATTRVVLYSLGLEELPAGEKLIDITLSKGVIPEGARVKVSSAISADSEGEAYSHMAYDAALGDIIQGVSDIYNEAASVRVDHGTIRVEAQQGVVVRVLDLQGRIVGNWTGSGAVNVAPGVYIVTGTDIKPRKVEVR